MAAGVSMKGKAEALLHGGAARGVVLKIMPGSPFVIKAMAALQAKGVDYDTEIIPHDKLATALPPPHFVPVLEVRSVDGGVDWLPQACARVCRRALVRMWICCGGGGAVCDPPLLPRAAVRSGRVSSWLTAPRF